MGLIYHAALENGLIMRFMILMRAWNAPIPVFCQLLDIGKMQLRIFLNSSTLIESMNHDSPNRNHKHTGLLCI